MAITQLDAARQVKDASVTDAKLAGGIALAKLAEPVVQADGGQELTGNLPAGGNKITGLGTPSDAGDSATKGYVDSVAQGLDPKGSVKAVATTNITLSGTQTVDGYAGSANDRILLTAQTDVAENGPWLMQAGAWTRPSDFDAAGDVSEGAHVYVEEGTVYEGNGFVLIELAGSFGSYTTQTWQQFTGAGQITAGAGLTKTGNTLDVAVDGTTTDIVGDEVVVIDSPLLEGLDSAYHLDRGNHTGALQEDLDAGAFRIINLGDPTDANDATNKAYVDYLAFGTAWKTSVRVATTANIADFGELPANVDGVTDFSIGQRILVKNQTAPEENGIYEGQFPGVLARAEDSDDWNEILGGWVAVEEGTANAGTLWRTTITQTGGTLDTDPIPWVNVPASAEAISDIVGAMVSGNTETGISVTYEDDDNTLDFVLDTEYIQDIIGAMVSGNTETNIAVTYDDINGKLDFVVTAASNRVVRETPTGAVNGSNTAFVLADAPAAGSEEVFLNGILQEPGAGNDYTISSDTITYLTAPVTGDKIRVSYVPA